MRIVLHQFFRPTEDEFRALWADAHISFDASVLLNVYGYSRSTRAEISDLFFKYKDRLILPHQFALEYARNRASVIVRQLNNCRAAVDAFNQIKTQRLHPKRENPHLTVTASAALETILTELEASRAEIEKLIGSDPHADMILTAFEGRVGTAPDEQLLASLHAQANERLKTKTPPGYADEKEKGIPGAYGDYIGWSQLMEISKERKRDIILVTDDSKEDWWQFEGSRTIAPRPELLAEFRKATSQRIWMYNSEGFLRAAQQFGEAVLSDIVLSEVKETFEAVRQSRALEAQKPAPSIFEQSDSDKLTSNSDPGKPIPDPEKD